MVVWGHEIFTLCHTRKLSPTGLTATLTLLFSLPRMGGGDGSRVLETPSFPRANPVKARSLLRPWITCSPLLQQRGGISESILVERILSAGTPPLRQLSPTRWSTRSYLCVPICVHTCLPVLANTYLENVN